MAGACIRYLLVVKISVWIRQNGLHLILIITIIINVINCVVYCSRFCMNHVELHLYGEVRQFVAFPSFWNRLFSEFCVNHEEVDLFFPHAGRILSHTRFCGCNRSRARYRRPNSATVCHASLKVPKDRTCGGVTLDQEGQLWLAK